MNERERERERERIRVTWYNMGAMAIPSHYKMSKINASEMNSLDIDEKCSFLYLSTNHLRVYGVYVCIPFHSFAFSCINHQPSTIITKTRHQLRVFIRRPSPFVPGDDTS